MLFGLFERIAFGRGIGGKTLLAAAAAVVIAGVFSACGRVDEEKPAGAEVKTDQFKNTEQNDLTEQPTESITLDDLDSFIDLEQLEAQENRARALGEMNAAAKLAYNAAAEIIADKETMGIPWETAITEAFVQSHTFDGVEAGFDKQYVAEGDKRLNDVLSAEFDKRYCAYVGLTEINGAQHFFVQIRDLDNGSDIGQFPDAVSISEAGSVNWTEFHIRGTAANTDGGLQTDPENDIKTLNRAAKEGYNLVCEMIADGETRGVDLNGTFESGVFDELTSEEGLVPSLAKAPEAEGDRNMNELLAGMYNDIAVYVGRTEIDGEEWCFVQVKDLHDDSLIGQYPAPAKDKGELKWREFKN